MVGGSQLVLGILQETLEGLDSLISRVELSLSNSNLLLQLTILLDELALDEGQLLEIPLEEGHLLLLGSVVGRSKDVVVLLSCFIQAEFQFDNLQPCQHNHYSTSSQYIPARICSEDLS